jgi:hypothetical protein
VLVELGIGTQDGIRYEDMVVSHVFYGMDKGTDFIEISADFSLGKNSADFHNLDSFASGSEEASTFTHFCAKAGRGCVPGGVFASRPAHPLRAELADGWRQRLHQCSPTTGAALAAVDI